MSTSSRHLRKLVATKSKMKEAEPAEAVAGLGKVMTAVGITANASQSGKSGSAAGGGTLMGSTLGGGVSGSTGNNVTLSTAVIAGAPDPVRLLSLTAENVRNTTELHMGRKGAKSIHPNFQHFVNLEILWLNQNDLTAVSGLIPAATARDQLNNTPPAAAAGSQTPKNITAGGHNGASTKGSTASGTAAKNAAPPSGLNEAVKQKPLSSTLLLIQNTAAFSNANANRNNGHMAVARREKEEELLRSGATMGDSPTANRPHSPNADGALNAALAVPPRGCRRLKHLYLSDNRISTVDGDLQKLKYLETLLLANNLLSDLHAVSRKLRHLLCLKTLDLFGNPLCEQQGYRLYMIAHHPTLEVLDRERITDAERRLAAEAHGNKRLNYEALTQRTGLLSTQLAKSGAAFNLSSLVEKDSVGSSSVRGGGGNNNNGNGEGGSDSDSDYGGGAKGAMNLSAKERSKIRAPVGFMTTVPPAAPMHRAEPISASVAILESRANMIHAERQAERRRLRDKEAAELSELAEQRRLFHAAWEGAAAHQEAQAQLRAEEAARSAALAAEQSMLLEQTAGGNGRRRGGAGSLNNTISGGGGGLANSPSSKGGRAGGGAAANQQAAAALQQQQAQQAQQHAMSEFRRLQATQAHHRSLEAKERLVSKLFNLDSDKAADQKIVEIIELQRRREEAENIGDEDQVHSIEAEIRTLQHSLLPERQGDVFKTAMAAENAATAEEDGRRYNTHIVEKVLLFPSELANVKKQFSERGSVFSLDRLRHLLTACVSSGNVLLGPSSVKARSALSAGQPTAATASSTNGPSVSFSSAASSSAASDVNTSAMTISSIISSSMSAAANAAKNAENGGAAPPASFVTPALSEAVKRAFIEKYPSPHTASGIGGSLSAVPIGGGRRPSQQLLPAIRNSGRALSIVSAAPEKNNAPASSPAAASATSPKTPTTSGTSPRKKGADATAAASQGPAAATASSGRPATSFSVDTALFMAMRDSASAEAALMAPIAVYDALIALSRVPAFVLAKRRIVEQLALEAMGQHQYARLKELQQRVNDLSAHLAALKSNMKAAAAANSNSGGYADVGSMVFLPPPPANAPSASQRRYSTVSNFSSAAFAAATLATSVHSPSSDSDSDDGGRRGKRKGSSRKKNNKSTTAGGAIAAGSSSSAADAALEAGGYVELINVKALWGAVQVRLAERGAEEAAAAAAAAVRPSTAASSTPQGAPLTAAALAGGGHSPLPPAGKRR